MEGGGVMAPTTCRCGHEYPAALGRYGCPNCEGDAMTPANERKAAERKRKREAGLVPLEVWVPKDDVAELQAFAHGLRLMHEEDQSSLPSAADVRGILKA